MARYIDADALKEKIDLAQTELETNNPVVFENNRKHWWGLVMARAMTDEQPTANVMTREEAGFYIEQARQEVAKEIFEEIRQRWARRLFECGDFSFKDFKFEDFAGDLDKLCKKFTEEDNQ